MRNGEPLVCSTYRVRGDKIDGLCHQVTMLDDDVVSYNKYLRAPNSSQSLLLSTYSLIDDEYTDRPEQTYT